jgi:hypothetical protein
VPCAARTFLHLASKKAIERFTYFAAKVRVLSQIARVFNPLYSYLSIAKGVNVRWVLGCKAENPDLAIAKIGSFYFPNFEE